MLSRSGREIRYSSPPTRGSRLRWKTLCLARKASARVALCAPWCTCRGLQLCGCVVAALVGKRGELYGVPMGARPSIGPSRCRVSTAMSHAPWCGGQHPGNFEWASSRVCAALVADRASSSASGAPTRGLWIFSQGTGEAACRSRQWRSVWAHSELARGSFGE